MSNKSTKHANSGASDSKQLDPTSKLISVNKPEESAPSAKRAKQSKISDEGKFHTACIFYRKPHIGFTLILNSLFL